MTASSAALLRSSFLTRSVSNSASWYSLCHEWLRLDTTHLPSQAQAAVFSELKLILAELKTPTYARVRSLSGHFTLPEMRQEVSGIRSNMVISIGIELVNFRFATQEGSSVSRSSPKSRPSSWGVRGRLFHSDCLVDYCRLPDIRFVVDDSTAWDQLSFSKRVTSPGDKEIAPEARRLCGHRCANAGFAMLKR